MLYEAKTVRSFNRATGFESQDFPYKIGLSVQKPEKILFYFDYFYYFCNIK